MLNLFQKIKRVFFLYQEVWKHRKMIYDYLYFLENKDKSCWGSITKEDEKGIAEAVKMAQVHPGPIVEVGTLFGHTTQLIASLKKDQKPLIAVENFSWNPFGLPKKDHQLITERTLRYCLEKCETSIFYGLNRDFYHDYKGEKPSMIFIDADHSYEGVKYDIEEAIKMGIPVISGHDYCDLFPGIKRAVEEVFGSSFQVIGNVWIAHKI